MNLPSMNLAKDMQGFYIENYTLPSKIKEDTKKGKGIPYSWIRILKIDKLSILSLPIGLVQSQSKSQENIF